MVRYIMYNGMHLKIWLIKWLINMLHRDNAWYNVSTCKSNIQSKNAQIFVSLIATGTAFKSTLLLRCGRDPRMHIRLERRSANESLVRSQTIASLYESWCVEEIRSASRFKKVVAAGPAPPVQVKTRGTNDACSSSRTRWPYFRRFSCSWRR